MPLARKSAIHGAESSSVMRTLRPSFHDIEQFLGFRTSCGSLDGQDNPLDLALQIFRMSHSDDAALIEDAHGVGHRLDLIQEMRTVEDRAFFSLQDTR